MSSSPSSTVASLFLDRIAETPYAEAYRYPVDGGWTALTWRRVGDDVLALAAGLRAFGLADEERVALLASTRMEWILCDFAVLCAGGATTTIYPSSTPDETAYIARDSDSRFVFVEDMAQVAKLASRRAELGHVRHLILMAGPVGDTHDGWVVPIEALRARGREALRAAPRSIEDVARAVRPDQLATLIYTSGTTGTPKGVELTHDCWAYEAQAIGELGLLHQDDVQLLWLPLAHSFAKVLQVAQLRIGFRTAIDGRVEKIVENLASVRPTFVAAVPRIFEKVHAKLLQTVAQSGSIKRVLFGWALKVGGEVSKLRQEKREPAGLLAFEHKIADALVLKKIRARFGGRLRFFVSGASPLARDLAEFFHAAGVLVLEGYGLTETSAASFVNRPDDYRFGTVGPPLPGTQVKLDPADNEILIKSRGVMRGYYRMPDATAEVLTPDGWLRTGDIGELDGGFLRITDRKKDLIKNSGGKYIAPQAIENRLKLASPLVSQALVHGNNRKFVSALVTLDPDAIGEWARDHGGPSEYTALTRDAKVVAAIQGAVDGVNRELAPHEQIKRFAILEKDLTIDAGELTPSMKLKRKAVEQKNQTLLDSFYA